MGLADRDPARGEEQGRPAGSSTLGDDRRRGARAVVADAELRAAVRTLPPKRRLIVFLRYFADLPYADIAAICEVSEGTVAATLSQARAELLALLERRR